jgi:RNA polymerase sigma-70 factor (ECF subfamily)
MGTAILLGCLHSAGRMEIIRASPADLVRCILEGDARAEDELVERYANGVRLVIRQSAPDGSVEDISQETFCLVVQKIRHGEVREPERLSGFIVSVARNLMIDHIRRTSRQRAREDPVDMAALCSPEPSPLDRLLQEQRKLLARRVLAAMPSERDRTVLFRFYIADEDKECICADLGLSSLHFNQVLFRAKERFRTLLEEMDSEKNEKNHRRGWNREAGAIT